MNLYQQEMAKDQELQNEMAEEKITLHEKKCSHHFDNHHSCKVCVKRTSYKNVKPKIAIDITDRHRVLKRDDELCNAKPLIEKPKKKKHRTLARVRLEELKNKKQHDMAKFNLSGKEFYPSSFIKVKHNPICSLCKRNRPLLLEELKRLPYEGLNSFLK